MYSLQYEQCNEDVINLLFYKEHNYNHGILNYFYGLLILHNFSTNYEVGGVAVNWTVIPKACHKW